MLALVTLDSHKPYIPHGERLIVSVSGETNTQGYLALVAMDYPAVISVTILDGPAHASTAIRCEHGVERGDSSKRGYLLVDAVWSVGQHERYYTTGVDRFKAPVEYNLEFLGHMGVPMPNILMSS